MTRSRTFLSKERYLNGGSLPLAEDFQQQKINLKMGLGNLLSHETYL